MGGAGQQLTRSFAQLAPRGVRAFCLEICTCPLLVVVDAVDCFVELRDQWSLTRLESVAAHDAPQISAL